MKYETFVPLYITNYCDSHCLICNMRTTNEKQKRVEGNKDQIMNQLKIIHEIEGISAICFLSGEYLPGEKRKKNLERIIWCIKEAISQGFEKIYFNIGSLYDNELKIFNDIFNGNEKLVLSLFQETYHKQCYKLFFGDNEIHNPKADYTSRLSVPEKWIAVGFKQVDIGILLGLRDPEYDILHLIQHASKLHDMGAIVHISLPRLKGLNKIPYNLSDDDFIAIVKSIKEKCPWANLIITTREDINIIKELINTVNIVSPGSSDILPYTEKGDIPNNQYTSQFQVAPIRKRPSWTLNSLQLEYKSIKYYNPQKRKIL